MLEDTDGDGKPDRVTVFADNLLAVSGMHALERRPDRNRRARHIYYMKDDNGDGIADTRENPRLPASRGSTEEAQGESPTRGFAVDNWIYCSNSGSDGKITSPDHPEDAAGSGPRRRLPLRSHQRTSPKPPLDPLNTAPVSTIGANASLPRTPRISATWSSRWSYLSRAPLLEVGRGQLRISPTRAGLSAAPYVSVDRSSGVA